jgi:hypothetical protein
MVNRYWTPRLCARHGQPATYRKNFKFLSTPPIWVHLLSPIPFLHAMVIELVRKEYKVKQWPFCDDCRTRRNKMRILGSVLLLATFAVGGLVMFACRHSDRQVLLIVIWATGVPLLFAMIGCLGVISRGHPTFLAGGRLSRQGHLLILKDPDEQFVKEANQAEVLA